jgi:hypothetical protein
VSDHSLQDYEAGKLAAMLSYWLDPLNTDIPIPERVLLDTDDEFGPLW